MKFEQTKNGDWYLMLPDGVKYYVGNDDDDLELFSDSDSNVLNIRMGYINDALECYMINKGDE